jgi:RNA polymerase sigma factor (sigma-70 family)
MLGPQWDPDDLVGPAELALLEQAAKYDPRKGAAFKTFALRRVYGACFSAARGRRYREAAHEPLDGEPLDSVSRFFAGSAADTPEEAIDARRMAFKVWRSLWRIPARHHMLIVRHYQRGETLEAIGARWGVTGPRVSQMHREALEMLRVMLK